MFLGKKFEFAITENESDNPRAARIAASEGSFFCFGREYESSPLYQIKSTGESSAIFCATDLPEIIVGSNKYSVLSFRYWEYTSSGVVPIFRQSSAFFRVN